MLNSATTAPRFVRRTQLARHEYRKNFRQLDDEIIAAITSTAADRVTPLMSKIYLRLVNAPACYFERDGVLRFESEVRDERHVKAWAVLCDVLGVASATANKALAWLHEQGIIGYFAGKNGVGVRIFLNRAAASIGMRVESAGKKILPFAPASNVVARASNDEPAFNDSYAVLETLDSDYDPHAPKNGATQTQLVETTSKKSCNQQFDSEPAMTAKRVENSVPVATAALSATALNELALRLRQELEPALTMVAARTAAREHERTRAWLEERGLPKAARVAQREAYNLLRQHGLIKSTPTREGREVCPLPPPTSPTARSLPPEELEELASTCLAMLEVHGQAVEATLAALSSDAGGDLSAADVAKVLALAQAMSDDR